MAKFIDLTGEKFGRLTVIKRVESHIEPSGGRRTMWLCKCTCGNTKIIGARELTRGYTKSCGCLHNEKTKQRTTKHGKINTRIYKIWLSMKQRCLRPSNPYYENYGARGIKVCDRWLDFENFYNDMYKSYVKHIKEFGEKDTTLDRIDVNGNYEPNNCRWATFKEQQNNRTNNHYIYYKGENLTISQLSEKYNIDQHVFRSRIILMNWSIEKALNTPIREKRCKING